MRLIDNELSEPYSIFTYRYFLHSWPHLCFLVFKGDHCFGTVVAKMDVHRGKALRGYIAMLTVEKPYRYLGVGSELVQRAIAAMVAGGCEEVALEAEVCNAGALRLYQKLGFIRDKRLHRYYLSGSDAYRLKLLLPGGTARRRAELEAAQELEALGLGEEQAQQAQQSQQQQQGQQQQGQQQQQPGEAAEQQEAEEALVHMQQHGAHDHQAAS
ncbi:N-terminal acetyltransferase complex C component MAK3 [Chlorella sorokiniana]|uniref:N-terminal acetyltransferase complex C component MAK3 n=1 Tax=Chlorella sorokiniana TaxID=3076 RepID=A0A2P6U0Q1_CHLSO|nr:N-terminal acetyltransferase complex C component MAK3 [Chlorella sorokiniana]|eukprot:PRW59895.1 N-terminal acetyltransferase complex C component MAK3 [Chlorella sorokiniana]